MSRLSGLWGLGIWTCRPSAVINREIDDELDFHLACLTQDLIASGLSPELAAAEANRRFGARETIRRQCQLIDYGHNRLLILAASSCFVIMVAAIGWLATLLQDAYAQNQQILQQLQALKPVEIEKEDLVGEIRDEQDRPVSNAKVLLIYKSWPDNRYKQDSFHTVSDKDGKFRFAKLYSTKTQTAFLVTVLAEGQTLQSEYVLYKPNEKVKSFRFQLKPALDKTFVLHGQDGEPLANTQVFPSSRTPRNSDEQTLIYHQSAKEASCATDQNGCVRLPYFATGDTVELQIADSESDPITLVVDQSDRQSINATQPKPAKTAIGRWAPSPVETEEPHVNWIRNNAVPFRPAVDDPNDFSDLQPLKALIGNSRIVQLGEQSHGDGACFQAKIRLIRFLHQEMGFDVLAFESGLYDCDRANQLLRMGVEPQKAAQEGVFSIWTGCSQIAPLWDHLAASFQTEKPLELAGFDCQFTGRASVEDLVDDLKLVAVKYHTLTAKEIESEEWQAFFTQLQRLATHQQFNGAKADWIKSLDVLIAGLEKDNPTGDADQRECGFWRQQLRSLKAYAQYTISESPAKANGVNMAQLNGRNAQMAENLIWLANQHYTGRKIIVWAASFHIMHNPAQIEVPDGSVDYTSIIPMGHHVHQELGKDIFTIAFTAANGKAGAWFRPSFSIGEAPEGTFEDICARTNLEAAVVPLRVESPDAAWLSEKIFSRPLGYTWMKAHWGNHFDAIVFQRTMEPATANQKD